MKEIRNDIENYLNKFKIYDLFHQMTNQLILNKPENPVNFLANYIEDINKKLICIFTHDKEYIKNLLSKLNLNILLKILDFEEKIDELNKEKTDLNLKIDWEELFLKKFKNEKFEEDDNTKSYLSILINFPNDKNQFDLLKKYSLFPDSIIIFNNNEESLKNILKEKYDSILVKNYITKTKMIKEIYGENIFYINENLEYKVLNELENIILQKITKHGPIYKKHIFIWGDNTSLIKDISNDLNNILKITKVFFNDVIKSNNLENEFNDKVIYNIFKDRWRKKDCQFLGSIVSNFPNNLQQFKLLNKNNKINFPIIFIKKEDLEQNNKVNDETENRISFYDFLEINHKHLLISINPKDTKDYTKLINNIKFELKERFNFKNLI